MRDTCNVDAIAAALIELTGLLNSPRQDEVLLGAAGVSLDRALFPLLVRLSASPAMGVAQLAAHSALGLSLADLATRWEAEAVYRPQMAEPDRRRRLERWNRALAALRRFHE